MKKFAIKIFIILERFLMLVSIFSKCLLLHSMTSFVHTVDPHKSERKNRNYRKLKNREILERNYERRNYVFFLVRILTQNY